MYSSTSPGVLDESVTFATDFCTAIDLPSSVCSGPFGAGSALALSVSVPLASRQSFGVQSPRAEALFSITLGGLSSSPLIGMMRCGSGSATRAPPALWASAWNSGTWNSITTVTSSASGPPVTEPTFTRTRPPLVGWVVGGASATVCPSAPPPAPVTLTTRLNWRLPGSRSVTSRSVIVCPSATSTLIV